MGAGALGCNLVLGTGSFSVGKTWGCVGSVTASPGEPGKTVTVTIHATEFTTQTPFTNHATIRACGLNDVACSMQIASATTDDAGDAPVTVPSGFDGYFEVLPAPDGSADAGTPAAETMVSLLYLSWPVVEDTAAGVELGTYDAYEKLVTSVEGHVPPGTGAIWVDTEDCRGDEAAGVRLSLDPPFAKGTDPFYFLNGAPVDAATQGETTSDAIGGFADVSPGRPEITATIASNGEVYARFTASVRAMGITFVELRPTPLH